MSENTIIIGGRKVGYNYPPVIIAEIGINHNGDINVAKQMVDAAKRSGVEIVKHQTHIVGDEMSSAAKGTIPGNAKVSIYEIMSRCSLNEEDEYDLKKYVESKGMIFLSTPFSRAAVDRLQAMGVCAFKIGSGECNNFPLIEYVSSFKKPIILSTGMNSMEDIAIAVAILRKEKVPFALMHTTNLYPTPDHLVRLGAMTELRNTFDCIIGLSDHTTNNLSSYGAIALGASIIERHFTDKMDREGPDIICSMDESACKELIRNSLIIFKQRGGDKKIIQEEQITRNFAFSSVCAINSIKAGQKFTTSNIWVKRPGTGEIHARFYSKILGKISKNDILNDEQLKWTDVENE